MVLEFVKSQRGKPKLKHEGYLYCLLREKDGLKRGDATKDSAKPLQQRSKTTFSQQMKVRTLIKSCVSLALIPPPPEDVIMGLNQVCSASESFPQNKCYLEYFEETWLGSPGRLGKTSKPLLLITLWNQFQNARNGNQKTNNNVEG